MSKTQYIQIGVAARRDSNGEFMATVPIFEKTDEPIRKSGLHDSEEQILCRLGALFATKHLQITEEQKCQGIKK